MAVDAAKVHVDFGCFCVPIPEGFAHKFFVKKKDKKGVTGEKWH